MRERPAPEVGPPVPPRLGPEPGFVFPAAEFRRRDFPVPEPASPYPERDPVTGLKRRRSRESSRSPAAEPPRRPGVLPASRAHPSSGCRPGMPSPCSGAGDARPAHPPAGVPRGTAGGPGRGPNPKRRDGEKADAEDLKSSVPDRGRAGSSPAPGTPDSARRERSEPIGPQVAAKPFSDLVSRSALLVSQSEAPTRCESRRSSVTPASARPGRRPSPSPSASPSRAESPPRPTSPPWRCASTATCGSWPAPR